MIRSIFWLLLLISTIGFSAGCGGKSHQAPRPDYENMTDEGERPEDIEGSGDAAPE